MRSAVSCQRTSSMTERTRFSLIVCDVAIRAAVDVRDHVEVRHRESGALDARPKALDRRLHQLAVPRARDVERNDALRAGVEHRLRRAPARRQRRR